MNHDAMPSMACHGSLGPSTPLSIMPSLLSGDFLLGGSIADNPWRSAVVNDSGVYLPPSPTDDKPSWPRRYLSRNSTDTRSDVGEIEPFGISRESFDSFRRSFVCPTQGSPANLIRVLWLTCLTRTGCLCPLSCSRQ